ncbi:tripartite tricarboxylate transporter substrate binding protein [Bordetella sp. BOR01]|uniref:Bug family tripartite tricarboxylate transporter substrate binding protein n=1 Tax=Bordetella sp. BOR01 TaxID=2854779 RepID=UPI001C457C17|nr:tripartite tricarboxylate transporter substrate binding protein [Bordetella sp. BOR01]MBV7481808.1 tripartite tricarboxylate transporter substrate binding protein [Bordetella sp. BOR01]
MDIRIGRLARAALLILPLLSAGLAGAQPGPRPVTLVVPYPPGGPADTVARVIAPTLESELGRPIIIDNRAGASGMIGAAYVAQAAPDGNTLLLNPTIHVILPGLMRSMPYDAVEDFTHLGVLVSVPLILAVNDKLPVKTVDELADYARAHLGTVNFASSSTGSSAHLAGEQFKLMRDLDIQHIPYKGSAPAITDLIGGQVQMMFDSAPSILPFVRSAKVRALVVTSPQRSAVAPELPTMVESGFPGFVHSNWYGLWGPRGMPPQAVQAIVAAMQRTMQHQDLTKKLVSQLGAEPVQGMYADAFKTFAASEKARYADLLQSAHIERQ